MSQKKKCQDFESSKEKWNREEDPLQAVVIADSFNSKFMPITAEKPRVLMFLNFISLIFLSNDCFFQFNFLCRKRKFSSRLFVLNLLQAYNI